MKKFYFQAKIPVRWFDMDAFGHVNNSVYLTYFEQARAMWWQQTGLKMDNQIEGPIQANAHVTYFKPIVYPATVIINLHAEPPGRSSLNIHYEIFLENDIHTKYAEGSTTIVWFDYKLQKSKPWPTKVLEHLAS